MNIRPTLALIGMFFSCSCNSVTGDYEQIISKTDSVQLHLSEIDADIWLNKEETILLKEILERPIEAEDLQDIRTQYELRLYQSDKETAYLLISNEFNDSYVNFYSEKLSFGFPLTYGLGMFLEEKEDAYLRQKAIRLNDRALEIQFDNRDSALTLLTNAIKTYPSLYHLYENIASVYIQKGAYDKAIEAHLELLELKPDHTEGLTMLGMLYDYTNQQDKAIVEYHKALNVYDIRLETADQNAEFDKINRALVLLLLDSSTASKELGNLYQTYPQNVALEMLLDFDKQSYLEEILNN